MLILKTLLFLISLSLTSLKKPGCQFPSSWQGIWFQQGVRPYITIDQDSISSKGWCHVIEGGHVMVANTSPSSQEPCYSCLVFHIAHKNLIHYKQTLSCQTGPPDDLASMCRKIPGDAPLFTLFRVDATLVRCPIQGPQYFSYDFGRGLCNSPMSSLESCTVNTRISLKYQACPTVPGTEMKDTQFECLASWKEGRNNFLVVKMEHSHLSKDEERFRCIMWETVKGSSKQGEQLTYMALSGDASCNGLYSTREGQTLVLHPVSDNDECSLPGWLTHGKIWKSLDMKLTLEITWDQSSDSAFMSVLRGEDMVSGARYYSSVETSRMKCASVKEMNGKAFKIIMHETRGCTTGYVCTEVTKLDKTVMELRLGQMSITKEYACDKEYFNASTPTFTLVGGPSSPCPLSGVFNVNIKHSDFSLAVKPDPENRHGGRMSFHTSHMCTLPYSLQLGCSHDRQSMLWSSCQNGIQETSSHQCITMWEDKDGLDYFITKVSKQNQYSCYSYHTDNDMKVVQMLGTQCKVGDINSFPFNISKFSECEEINTSEIVKSKLLITFFIAIACLLLPS